MVEDAELLRRYAQEHSESAFAELVRRRIDLVYSVALRQVGGDAHLAHDVTQRVFTDLARKAGLLLDRTVLSGWLCRSAQYAASGLVRAERRRRFREEKSQAMNETTWTPESETDWNKVRPLLDEALAELNELDRDAVALRFLEGRPFAEIGARLALSEDAARKRIERALDKMAAALARRGVRSSVAAVGVALTGHVTTAAPSGLAAAIATSSLTSAAGMTTAAGLAGLGVALKFALGAAGAVAALGAGWAVYQTHQAAGSRAELAALQAEHAKLRARSDALAAALADERARAQAAEEDSAKLLNAIAQARAVPASTVQADLVRETVAARYKRAQDLMRDARWSEALAELLWCYDDGMLRDPSFSGMRLGVLLMDIAKVAQHDPSALAALRERRDRAQQRLLAQPPDERAAHDFTSLNRILREESRTLEVYDQLRATDPQRRRLVQAGTFQLLVDARRYADAAREVSYDRMVAWFDRESRPPSVTNEPYPEMALRRHRRNVVADAVKSVEVLAGSGDLARAREFASRILAFDNSNETRETLMKHATRSGQPALLHGLAGW